VWLATANPTGVGGVCAGDASLMTVVAAEKWLLECGSAEPSRHTQRLSRAPECQVLVHCTHASVWRNNSLLPGRSLYASVTKPLGFTMLHCADCLG
jgi:hypothetical protein